MTFWRGVLKVFKRPRKPTAEKSKSENPRRKRPIVGKYGIQSTNEMAFKRPATLRASFRFPAIRFDASTLLLFSGFTHAHAKCPPVNPWFLRLSILLVANTCCKNIINPEKPGKLTNLYT